MTSYDAKAQAIPSALKSQKPKPGNRRPCWLKKEYEVATASLEGPTWYGWRTKDHALPSRGMKEPGTIPGSFVNCNVSPGLRIVYCISVPRFTEQKSGTQVGPSSSNWSRMDPAICMQAESLKAVRVRALSHKVTRIATLPRKHPTPMRAKYSLTEGYGKLIWDFLRKSLGGTWHGTNKLNFPLQGICPKRLMVTYPDAKSIQLPERK